MTRRATAAGLDCGYTWERHAGRIEESGNANTMSDRDRQHLSPLEYETPRPSAYQRGATRAARVASGVCSLLFIVLAVAIWHLDSRGEFSVRSLADIPVLLALAGSGFCMLVAFGRLGRHTDG